MKKELYFTEENREEKTREWLDICKEIKERRPFDFSLQNTALIIVDMQHYFTEERCHAFVPSSKTIIPNIERLVDCFTENNRPIIVTKHETSAIPTELMNRFWKNRKLGEEDKKLVEWRTDAPITILKKSHYSAFYQTGLEELLKQENLTQVVIVGVMSHLCCESTTRDAFMRDIEVFFVVDGCATYTEQLHVGTMQAISHGFGVCVSVEEVIEWANKT